MTNLDALEQRIILFTDEELLHFLFEKRLIHNHFDCPICFSAMKLEKARRLTENYCWRCYNQECSFRYKRHSLRTGSFFADFGMSIRLLLRVLIRYACRQPAYSILEGLTLTRPTYKKLMKQLILKMAVANLSERKLGGPGFIVQVDETMLNYKVKSHKGRPASNESDAICLVECGENGSITRVWAEVIDNKRVETLLPIINRHVNHGAVIHTDEHRSYGVLGRSGFIHGTVCHKYTFVNRIDNVHTQAVESFNNCVKLEIKKRKGVWTTLRNEFLDEFTWCWNNKQNLFESLIELIKV